MILGGYNFELINTNYKNYFKPHSFDYDKLYLELYMHSNFVKEYSILFDNEIVDVHINDELPEPKFDEKGSIMPKSINFYQDIDNIQISVDENHIPKKIWFRKWGKENERVQIVTNE